MNLEDRKPFMEKVDPKVWILVRAYYDSLRKEIPMTWEHAYIDRGHLYQAGENGFSWVLCLDVLYPTDSSPSADLLSVYSDKEFDGS